MPASEKDIRAVTAGQLLDDTLHGHVEYALQPDDAGDWMLLLHAEQPQPGHPNLDIDASDATEDDVIITHSRPGWDVDQAILDQCSIVYIRDAADTHPPR